MCKRHMLHWLRVELETEKQGQCILRRHTGRYQTQIGLIEQCDKIEAIFRWMFAETLGLDERGNHPYYMTVFWVFFSGRKRERDVWQWMLHFHERETWLNTFKTKSQLTCEIGFLLQSQNVIFSSVPQTNRTR